MIQEIRRQFPRYSGLLEGTAEPDAARCVDIATTSAIKRMLLPAALAVLGPVVVGFGMGAEALGGMLGGALLAAVLLALTMANAGGAWDNAKKHVEKGNFGGKGSETHKANVVGDTVGDPFEGHLRSVDEYPDQCDGHRQSGDCTAAWSVVFFST